MKLCKFYIVLFISRYQQGILLATNIFLPFQNQDLDFHHLFVVIFMLRSLRGARGLVCSIMLDLLSSILFNNFSTIMLFFIPCNININLLYLKLHVCCIFLFDDTLIYSKIPFRVMSRFIFSTDNIYIMAVSFIGGGNQMTWGKSPTCRKSLTTLSHNVLSTPCHERDSISTVVVIDIDCTGSCKSNYHTIMTTWAPQNDEIRFY